MEETRFIVFTAGFNSANWVKKNINSIKKQNYSNYVHIIVDDATTDNTNKIIQKLKHKQLIVYRNEKNIKWVSNALKYLSSHIENDEDVIVIVDMDDWLPNKNVLSILNKKYTKEKVWLTYGNYAVYNNNNIIKKVFNKTEQINKRKNMGGSYIHLRTFKAFLWNAINKDDLKGPNGKYISCTYDRAIMYPMMEMCPREKIHHFEKVMYIYNGSNTLNVSKIMGKQQKDLKKWFLEKPPYKVLKK